VEGHRDRAQRLPGGNAAWPTAGVLTLSSMTGFARREGALDAWTWAVEVRSVNGRSLDVRLRAPMGFEGLERLGRDAAQARFQRGQITIGVQARRAEELAAPRINRELLERYAELASEIATGRSIAPASADGLLALRGVLEPGDAEMDEAGREALQAAAAQTLTAALDALVAARQAEGATLATVLLDLLERIEVGVREAEAQASQQALAIRDRFARGLAELLGEAVSEERVLHEASVMSLKADVREELDRLLSHIKQAHELVAQGGAIGRRLDFLSQEFMREANTLCSKSATIPLTTAGLALKASVDQLREQVQNVE
jgi:uncharacterized protein (TIGR00255 family)